MLKLTFLGTASAVPDKDHHNTHFLLQTKDCNILVDCGENPIPRLDQVDVDPLSITDIILTHFHPDHVAGVPLFLMDLWLMGKKDQLTIHALDEVIDGIEKILDLFDWDQWSGLYPVEFHRIPKVERFQVLSTGTTMLYSSPGCHLIPSISFRIEVPEGAVCYSSDTSPCEAVTRLAEGVNILIHEAGGLFYGHSSAEQAGQIAEQANVETLYLIHYPPDQDLHNLVVEAKNQFSGEVNLAWDLMTVSFG